MQSTDFAKSDTSKGKEKLFQHIVREELAIHMGKLMTDLINTVHKNIIQSRFRPKWEKLKL